MIKNTTFRRWFSKHFPIKYAKIIEDEINRDFLVKKDLCETHTERCNVESRRNYDLQMVSEELDEYFTNKIVKQAKRLDIPIPYQPRIEDLENDDWILSTLYSWVLKDGARHKLRIKIREEKKSRRDEVAYYLYLISGFIGIVIGLLSLIKDFL